MMIEKLVEVFCDAVRERQKKDAGIADEFLAPALGSFPLTAAHVAVGLTAVLEMLTEDELKG